MLRRFYTVLISLLALCTASIAAETYSYPELNVTPLSSTRLKMEVAKETKRSFLQQPAIQLTALATFASGLAMLDNGNIDRSDLLPNEKASKIPAFVGMAVGAAWVFLPNWMGKKKYSDAYRSIYKLPTKTKRERLLKERLAEEELRSIRSFSWRMRILSAATNVGALAYMMSTSKSGIAQPTIIASIILNLTPLLLSCPWKNPADQQELYKKKIYGPIASATLLQDPKSNKFVPGLLFGLRF